jgi:hypothetical protein
MSALDEAIGTATNTLTVAPCNQLAKFVYRHTHTDRQTDLYTVTNTRIEQERGGSRDIFP